MSRRKGGHKASAAVQFEEVFQDGEPRYGEEPSCCYTVWRNIPWMGVALGVFLCAFVGAAGLLPHFRGSHSFGVFHTDWNNNTARAIHHGIELFSYNRVRRMCIDFQVTLSKKPSSGGRIVFTLFCGHDSQLYGSSSGRAPYILELMTLDAADDEGSSKLDVLLASHKAAVYVPYFEDRAHDPYSCDLVARVNETQGQWQGAFGLSIQPLYSLTSAVPRFVTDEFYRAMHIISPDMIAHPSKWYMPSTPGTGGSGHPEWETLSPRQLGRALAANQTVEYVTRASRWTTTSGA